MALSWFELHAKVPHIVESCTVSVALDEGLSGYGRGLYQEGPSKLNAK